MRPVRGEKGFTLLELLLAVTLTLVLAGVILAVTTTVLNLWRRSQDAFVSDAQAKAVLDFLERDLQAAVFRDDGGTWLAVDVFNNAATLTNHGWLVSGPIKPSPGVTLASSLAESRFGLSGAWLRFVTTNVEAGGSLPVAVSYQIARRPVAGAVAEINPAAIRYSLFRSAVSPETTFSTGYNLRSGYAHSGATPPAQRSAGTLTNPSTADALATNVVEFGVWLYSRNAAGELTRMFPNAEGNAAHTATTAMDFPAVVDVTIRILSEEGAQLIEQIEAANGAVTRPAHHATDAAWWWSAVETHSRVYVRRIEIRGGEGR